MLENRLADAQSALANAQDIANNSAQSAHLLGQLGKFVINAPEFYADLAKAFLFDKDAKSPKDKISAYYNCIVDVGRKEE